jgi:hypothetical protein
LGVKRDFLNNGILILVDLLTSVKRIVQFKELHVFLQTAVRSTGVNINFGVQKFEEERFNVRTLKELEVKEKYQIEITNRFATLENLNVDEDVNRVWKNIKENIKTSAKDSLGLHE